MKNGEHKSTLTLSAREQRLILSQLREGEELQLVVRPVTPFLEPNRLVKTIFSMLGAAFLVGCGWQEAWWADMAVVGTGVGVFIVSYIRARLGNYYLLTSDRALRLQRGKCVQSWDREPGMIKAVKLYPDGRGDVVLGYHWLTGMTENGTDPNGFMNVPQVLRVVEVMADYIGAAPQDVPAPELEPPDGCLIFTGCLLGLLGAVALFYEPQTAAMIFALAGVLSCIYLHYRRKYLRMKQQMTARDAKKDEQCAE